MDWQLIKSAPKDGTRVFVGHIDGAVYIARFLTQPRPMWTRDGGEQGFPPTHWMPLRDPPKS